MQITIFVCCFKHVDFPDSQINKIYITILTGNAIRIEDGRMRIVASSEIKPRTTTADQKLESKGELPK